MKDAEMSSAKTPKTTAPPKFIPPLEFTVSELDQCERELLAAMDGVATGEDAVRISRILSNKFGYCRSMIRAQHWLEKQGYITTSLEGEQDGRTVRQQQHGRSFQKQQTRNGQAPRVHGQRDD